jgi:DNA-binding transcriptional LysR family regulator
LDKDTLAETRAKAAGCQSHFAFSQICRELGHELGNELGRHAGVSGGGPGRGAVGRGATPALDPATAGRRVARLEASLGAVLFAKSPQGYALTEAGQRLLAKAEAAEAALAGGLDEGQGGQGGLSGAIRIGAPDGCANYLLPQVCAAIAADNPGLDIQILALPRVVNLSRREADLAIAVSPPKTDRLSAEKLADYRLSLAATRDYLARKGRHRRARRSGARA